jgi:hypothetical protein
LITVGATAWAVQPIERFSMMTLLPPWPRSTQRRLTRRLCAFFIAAISSTISHALFTISDNE